MLGPGRADVWTPDLQALVSVEAPRPVSVALTPRDPSRLPALPGLAASGNAYEVVLDGAVDTATVVLRPPHRSPPPSGSTGTRPRSGRSVWPPA